MLYKDIHIFKLSSIKKIKQDFALYFTIIAINWFYNYSFI